MDADNPGHFLYLPQRVPARYDRQAVAFLVFAVFCLMGVARHHMVALTRLHESYCRSLSLHVRFRFHTARLGFKPKTLKRLEGEQPFSQSWGMMAID